MSAVELVASTARIASGVSAAQSVLQFGAPGRTKLNILVDVTVALGSSPTLDLTVEWSSDEGVTWFLADTADAMTQITAAGKFVKQFNIKAEHFRVRWTLAGTGTGEVSTVDSGLATGGTFTLSYNAEETGTIAENANAATVETAVEALTVIVAATVTGAGTGGDPWVITIDNPKIILAVTGDGSLLTPAVALNLTETTPGVTTVKEVTTVDIGAASGGTFTLTVDAQTTSNIVFDAAASVIKTAVEALSTVTTVTVTGVGTSGDPWIITFDVPTGVLAVSGDGSNLTASDTLTVTETTAGVDAVKEVTTIDIGGALGGTWTLTVDGQTTSGIVDDAADSVVETAVEALSTVTAATVTGAGTIASPWIITIDDPEQSLTITGDGGNLTPDDTLTIVETTPGVTIDFTFAIDGDTV